MRPAYKTILCATDCSPAADRTLPVAFGLADRGSAVHVATVVAGGAVGTTLFPGPERDPSTRQGTVSSEADKARQHLEALVAGGARDVGEVRIHVLRGWDPVQVIEGLAHELRADILVVGTHGQAGFGRLLLGSVATDLLRRRNVTVLLLNEARPAMPGDRPAR